MISVSAFGFCFGMAVNSLIHKEWIPAIAQTVLAVVNLAIYFLI